ncbi:MAG: ankyrin repeat domain-containing protein [Burkholderiaceae bacterium]
MIGAASLGTEQVGLVLLQHGAKIDSTSVHGAGALHWAAYTGLPRLVSALLERGADAESKCTEFGASPLFWAVQGFSRFGPKKKAGQLEAAKTLLLGGADANTRNITGVTALSRSRESDAVAMTELLLRHDAQA